MNPPLPSATWFPQDREVGGSLTGGLGGVLVPHWWIERWGESLTGRMGGGWFSHLWARQWDIP